MLINLTQHFLYTTPSLNFTYALLKSVFCTCCGTFFHLQSHEGNSCSPVKAKTVSREKFELSRPTFSCHYEKEVKAKKLQRLPKTLEQAMKQSQR